MVVYAVSKAGKLHFGSKWLNLHGRFFIGNPERFGLSDCRENVLTSYYYLRADRKMPVANDEDFDAWRMDALRASQVRHASENMCPKPAFLSPRPRAWPFALGHWSSTK